MKTVKMIFSVREIIDISNVFAYADNNDCSETMSFPKSIKKHMAKTYWRRHRIWLKFQRALERGV